MFIFTIAGIMVSGENPVAGILILIFFGSLTIGSASIVINKYRQYKLLTGKEIVTALPIGVRFYISKTKLYFIDISLALSGLIGLFCFFETGDILIILGTTALFVTGVKGIINCFSGEITSEYIELEKSGLRIGTKNYSYLVLWENIGFYEAANYRNNPAIMVHLIDEKSLLENLQAEENRRETVKKLSEEFKSIRKLTAADVVVVPGDYGIDQIRLYKAIEQKMDDLKGV